MSVRGDGWGHHRPAIPDHVVFELPKMDSSGLIGRCPSRCGPQALVMTTNRTDYQGLAVSCKSIRRVGRMKIGRRSSIPCDGAGHPRGETRYPTRTVETAQEAVPSRI